MRILSYHTSKSVIYPMICLILSKEVKVTTSQQGLNENSGFLAHSFIIQQISNDYLLGVSHFDYISCTHFSGNLAPTLGWNAVLCRKPGWRKFNKPLSSYKLKFLDLEISIPSPVVLFIPFILVTHYGCDLKPSTHQIFAVSNPNYDWKH